MCACYMYERASKEGDWGEGGRITSSTLGFGFVSHSGIWYTIIECMCMGMRLHVLHVVCCALCRTCVVTCTLHDRGAIGVSSGV